MRIEWLELSDFRSYDTLRVDFGLEVNILVGDNGLGKTNILEAIAYLSRLRSFRGAADKALIRSGSARAIVRGEFSAAGSSHLVEVEIPEAGRRRVRWNGKQPRRFSDLAAEVAIVAFLPDDVALVKGGPVARRDYLDSIAAALSPVAGASQADLTQALKQRNALLRNRGRAASDSDLDVWDAQIAAAGAKVLEARLEIAAIALPVIERVYGEIGEEREVNWAYTAAKLGELPELVAPTEAEERYRELLAAARSLDKDRKMTTVGPHRDDPALVLGGMETRSYASQGEQRTLALAMRLASFELIANRRPDPPVVILDDVFSELDSRRASGVIAGLPDAQTIIATARREDVPAIGKRFDVTDAGVVTA